MPALLETSQGTFEVKTGIVIYSELGYTDIDGLVCLPGTVIPKSDPRHKGKPVSTRVCATPEPLVGYRCTCWRAHKHADHVAHDAEGNVLAVWTDHTENQRQGAK